jgi:hypothetical protein
LLRCLLLGGERRGAVIEPSATADERVRVVLAALQRVRC